MVSTEKGALSMSSDDSSNWMVRGVELGRLATECWSGISRRAGNFYLDFSMEAMRYYGKVFKVRYEGMKA